MRHSNWQKKKKELKTERWIPGSKKWPRRLTNWGERDENWEMISCDCPTATMVSPRTATAPFRKTRFWESMVTMKASWSSINELLLFVISSISTIPGQRFQHHSLHICFRVFLIEYVFQSLKNTFPFSWAAFSFSFSFN